LSIAGLVGLSAVQVGRERAARAEAKERVEQAIREAEQVLYAGRVRMAQQAWTERRGEDKKP
jgi:hypothetical protein